MKYLDFEKHIKKEFEGSKEAVQMDALLASLNLGKEPRRKGLAFWKIVPFLMLAISVFAWIYISQPNGSNTTLASDEVQTTETLIEEERNSNAINATSNKTQSEQNTAIEDNVPNTSKSNLSTSENIEISTTEKTISEQAKQTKLNAKTSTFNASMISSDVNSRPSNEAQSTPQDIFQSKGSTVNSNDTPQLDVSMTSFVSQPAESSAAKAMASRSLLTVADLESSMVTLDFEEDDGNLFSRMKINCPSFDNVGWHMALIPEVGVFYPKKTLTNYSGEQSAAYNERINSESTLEGIELGLYGMLVRDNVPFYLKAGISYSRIAERMDLKYEYTEQDTTIGIISSTVSDNGDTITHIYGDIITETTFKGSNRQHHYIHLFDIPISIGYTTYIGGLDVGIEGGVKVNFMTRATGNLLTSRSEYTNLSLNRLFKNRIGLSYFGGLMIGRNFGRFGDFYIAPRFTYYPNDFNNSNNSIGQRYFTVGLNAGLVYKIN